MRYRLQLDRVRSLKREGGFWLALVMTSRPPKVTPRSGTLPELHSRLHT